jgi:hypothetical protein
MLPLGTERLVNVDRTIIALIRKAFFSAYTTPSPEPAFCSPKHKVRYILNDCGKPSIALQTLPVLVEVFFACLAWPALYVAGVSFGFQDAVLARPEPEIVYSKIE